MSSISTKILPKPEGKKEQDLYNVLDTLFVEVRKIINGGLLFSDNFAMTMKSLTTSATPDAENTLAHGLGKTPTGYIIYAKDKAGDLYTSTGGTAWDATSIYLKSNVASVTFKILIF